MGSTGGVNRGRQLGAVGFAVAVVAVAAAGAARLTPDRRADPGVVAVESPRPDVLVVASPAPLPGESLDAAYRACAVEAGFDPEGVQVLVGVDGKPQWVKTGRDVPARVHGPCFERIGGTDPRTSSHGRPG